MLEAETARSSAPFCLLCHRRLAGSFCMDEEGGEFCCRGCQVVHAILKAQGGLAQFEEHPVYRQAVQSGLISAPEAVKTGGFEEGPDDEFHTWHLVIEGMWCPSCAQLIHLVLLREKGVRRCTVDYATDLAAIEYTPRFISRERIAALIRKLGYAPQPLQDPRERPVSRDLLLRFIVAAFFSTNVMMFAYPLYAAYVEGGDADGYLDVFAWLSFWAALPVLLYSAWPIWRRGFAGAKVGLWGMEVLVALGVAAAVGLSLYELSRGGSLLYFDSATVIITLVLLGKILESRAKFSAKDALLKLAFALPRRGRKRFSSGEERFVPIKEIQPGDCLVVRTGEKIVLDGVVEEGSGLCDEALMTGEARSVPKAKGALLIGGTLLQQGSLLFRVTASLEQSLLQRILDAVGRDIGHKSRYVRAADRLMRGFVPFVLLLASGTALFCLWQGIEDPGETVMQTAVVRAVSVLLISCPCAIGIAAPLAEAHLLNRLAKLGVIVRNRGCLAHLGRETVFIFDKTGTLTEGRFTPLPGELEKLSRNDRSALKGITAHSLHPVAAALHTSLSGRPAPFEKVEELVGKGLRGVRRGASYCLGSASFMREQGIFPPGSLPEPSCLATQVYFARRGGRAIPLQLGDRLRPGASDFIHSLAPLQTLLLSGDAPSSVRRTAEACGIRHWHAEHSPLQKKALIDELKRRGEVVAMLGDGVNDAPALTAAHVGIAVASAADISVHVSDLLLTAPSFQALSSLRRMASNGQKIVKQNLFWAFFYNAVGLGLAAAGLLTPLFAAFAMAASSAIIVLNTGRLSSRRADS